VELAAAYRLAHEFGWEELIYNHMTVRLPITDPNEPEKFLINSFGQGWDEVTSSSLVTVDVHGNIVDPGSVKGVINPGECSFQDS
jgi:ribulose-5-phosphate 4-epimerase/fuculose-1-phosphate aldolase